MDKKEEGANSTFDEVYTLAKYAKDNSLNHLIIVTDAFQKVFKLQGLDNVKLERAVVRNEIYLENN